MLDKLEAIKVRWEDVERESLDDVSEDLGKIEDLLKMLSIPGANTTIH